MTVTVRQQALVLIVDDDISLRMLMRASLQKVGYRVAEAEDGQQALDMFGELNPDAVLLDVMMPGLDGFETCQRLRQLPGGEHTPVLMVTGLEEVDSIHRAFEVGATDFVSKPINWTMLGYRVRYMLRASEAFLDLHQSQIQLAEAQKLAKLGNWELNPETRTLAGSAEFLRITGLGKDAQETSLDQLIDSVHPVDREAFKMSFTDAIPSGEPFSLDYRGFLHNGEERVIHLSGETFRKNSGRQSMLRGFVQDVTELRKAEEQIRYLAYYDGLTGLANRELFKDRLHKALPSMVRQKHFAAIMFLDLDRFKRINDTLGHHAGDLLLKQVAERLNYCIRESDSVARFGSAEAMTCVSRLGGDEFTILLTDLNDPQDAVVVAQRIIETIPQPLSLQGHEVHVTTSIGISVFPNDGEDPDTLLKHADAAMYEAKSKGRNNFKFFEQSLNRTTSARLSLESDLRMALENDEFLLHYQPQVDMQSGHIVGAEALLRWESPSRGLVPPDEFITLAEESGLIVPLTNWLIKSVCEQSKLWQSAGLPPLRISVNISGQHFSRQDIADTARRYLQANDLDPCFLEIELTESALMDNKDVARDILGQLQELGLSVAIDDFGTGYSSLAYLKEFPIDTLKIDRSFVRDIATDQNDVAIIKAVVAMAQSLELKVVAEGVEDDQQLNFLQQLGCNAYQGFLFSRPLPAQQFAARLKESWTA